MWLNCRVDVFSGSNCLDPNVGSCRPAVRETRVEMQVEEEFTGTTIPPTS